MKRLSLDVCVLCRPFDDQQQLTEEQLVKQATHILIENLGLVETARFMALTSGTRIESVERHRAWQATLEKDQFFDEVFSAPRKS